MRMQYAIVSIVLMLVAFPTFAHTCDDYWTFPQGIGGKKVVGCDEATIENTVWDQYRDWANARSNTTYEYIIQDVDWYNGETQTREGPVWDHWRECTWQATYRCCYKRIPLN
jgi:hypothetical protein